MAPNMPTHRISEKRSVPALPFTLSRVIGFFGAPKAVVFIRRWKKGILKPRPSIMPPRPPTILKPRPSIRPSRPPTNVGKYIPTPEEFQWLLETIVKRRKDERGDSRGVRVLPLSDFEFRRLHVLLHGVCARIRSKIVVFISLFVFGNFPYEAFHQKLETHFSF